MWEMILSLLLPMGADVVVRAVYFDLVLGKLSVLIRKLLIFLIRTSLLFGPLIYFILLNKSIEESLIRSIFVGLVLAFIGLTILRYFDLLITSLKYKIVKSGQFSYQCNKNERCMIEKDLIDRFKIDREVAKDIISGEVLRPGELIFLARCLSGKNNRDQIVELPHRLLFPGESAQCLAQMEVKAILMKNLVYMTDLDAIYLAQADSPIILNKEMAGKVMYFKEIMAGLCEKERIDFMSGMGVMNSFVDLYINREDMVAKMKKKGF